MMLTSFLIIIFNLNVVTMDSALGQEYECGGALSNVEFDDIPDLCAYYAKCTQPTYKLNMDCILLSCPLLSGMCPMNFDDSLKSTMTILNACIGQDSLICGINMSHTPIAQIGWTTKNILPVGVVNGTVNSIPGTGFIDNLSSANFTLMQTDNPKGTISLHIQAPNITAYSYYTCTFNLTENSFLQPLTRQLTTFNIPNSLNTPNVFSTYNNLIATTVSIEMLAPTPIITILDDQSDIDIVFSNFTSADKLPLSQPLVDKFNQVMQKYVKNSVMTSTTINFLSTYIALGLQVAQLNCS